MKHFLMVSVVLLLAGCASTLPHEEMAIAETAIRAARQAEANIYATRPFQEAEKALRSAKRAFKLREFEYAKEFAVKARLAAEKAENIAVLKKERGI
jgi:outer membrane biogenesis lipoprotein LolB